MNSADSPDPKDTYTRLIEVLDQHAAEYKLIRHQEEGRCEIISAIRGNALSQAAKCMICMVKIGKKDKRFVLAVIPGDAKVNFNAIKDLFHGSYAAFADQDIAEKLAQTVAGTVLPFSFSPELILIVDPSLKEHEFIYFNAARLDESVKLKTSDYLRIANPRFERITGADVKKKLDYY